MERPTLQDTDEDRKRSPPCSSAKEGTEVVCLRGLEGKHHTAAGKKVVSPVYLLAVVSIII